MQIRKWLALLVSAALALSLLAGCGGKNQSLAQVILDLLDGQYANVTVEIDPDLEADLRQAVHEGETEEEIRAALEKILGSGVSFRLIGDGQQGDSAWNLILYPGSDPDAAARSAFTEWNKVFGSLPRDGQYTAQIAMIETENGYAILVKATVDKAASRDDDDDEPEDVVVKGTGFTYNVTQKTITVESNNEAGLQNLLTKQDGEAKEIADARNSGFEKITNELAAGKTYTVSQTFAENNGTFKGTLKGGDKETTIIKLTDNSKGLFEQIDTNGKVENITFDVQTEIKNTYAVSVDHFAGAVAGLNNGTIQNCDVTINAGYSITANGGGSDDVYAGGIVGTNESGGEISGCKVTINGGSITADSDESDDVYAGGIAGENQGWINNCDVEGSYKDTGDADISTNNEDDGSSYAGGIAGYNQSTGTVEDCSVTNCKIKAGGLYGWIAVAGGIAGYNQSTGTVEGCSVTNCKIKAGGLHSWIAVAGGIVGGNHSNGEVNDSSAMGCDITAQLGTYVADPEIGHHPEANAHAGATIGHDEL